MSSLAIILGLLPLCPSTTTPKISGESAVEVSLAGQNRPSCRVNIFNPSFRSFSSSVAVREGSEYETNRLVIHHDQNAAFV